MKVERSKSLTIRGEGPLGDPIELKVYEDYRGEPYRRGVTISVNDHFDHATLVHTFLERHEAERVRDLIDQIYPRK